MDIQASQSNHQDSVSVVPPLSQSIEITDPTINNVAGTWDVNQWYQSQFSCLVCVQTKGQTILSKADLAGWIHDGVVQTERGVLNSAATYVKRLLADDWRIADDSFMFPVLNGEYFMIRKSAWSPLPDGMDIKIQVIPYPSP